MLNKKSILDADDLLRETLHIPEWDGDVLIRGLSSAGRDKISNARIRCLQSGGESNISLISNEAMLAGMVLINDDGTRMFTDQEIASLAQKSGEAIHRIVEVAERISGLTDSGETAKNSVKTQTSASASA